MLSQIYLFLIVLSFTRAEIVTGKCPTVSETNFNCTEVLHNFYEAEYLEDYQKHVTLLIHGFIPSSSKSKTFNIFAFDFPKGVSISDYFAMLSCNSQRFLTFHCGYFIPMRPFKQIGIDFKVRDQHKEEKFELAPYIGTKNNKDCNSYLIQNFDYVTRISPGKYLAIWGCYQVSETSYDRGLWVFGANQNQTDFEVSNVEGIVEAALKDMKLDQTINISRDMLINRNIFQDYKKCEVDRFYFRCNKVTPYDRLYLTQRQKEKEKEEKEKKLTLLILVSVILLVIVLGICTYIIRWLIKSIMIPFKRILAL